MKKQEDQMACSGVFGTEACFKNPEDNLQMATEIGFAFPAKTDRQLEDVMKVTTEHRTLIRQLYSKEEEVDRLKEQMTSMEQKLKTAQDVHLTSKKEVGIQDEEQVRLAKQVRENEGEISKLKQFIK